MLADINGLSQQVGCRF